ncbi:response regulator [Mucilaginibacter xinganensis]|uniref:DNA-binding response regulator n=1 Tax=Mucilaginibacter xinganensis TaxID=1234841 RepID=A0A223P3H4_9SPHI|nr:response regulator transcription factor [Mucilaginibacter xinganensis]ASU36398.1 DNA-binding response regulator [Mucilaginibacter xinganensis]
MIKIIQVEDHCLVTEGVRTFIAAEPDMEYAASCNSGENLVQVLQSRQPDVILMDINLPDTTGIELCKLVKDKYPGVMVLALSINNQPGIIRKMTESGASGYVLKDASRQEIIDAIRTVAKGKTYFSRSVSTALRKTDTADLPPLTRREREVLELIADGYTNSQIAESLFVDVTTIDFHRKNMLSKYKVKNTAALIKVAVSNNLI